MQIPSNVLALFLLAISGSLASPRTDLHDKDWHETETSDMPPGIHPNLSVEPDSKCKEHVERGNGSAKMTRYFFDPASSSCREFIYTGDGGNENNFETELDCLNDCYTGVSEGVPVREEDVVFIGHDADKDDSTTSPAPLAATSNCLLPKDTGNCTRATQNFYFLPEWQSCVAFVYSGCGGNENRFTSRIECEQTCLVQDGSICRGPSASLNPLKIGEDCISTLCPVGSVCAMGPHAPECCKADEHELLEKANAAKCENGAKAGGHFVEYFAATFALNCNDLICASGERCVMHTNNKDASAGSLSIAKCCKTIEPLKPIKNKNKSGAFSEILA